jgi:hypothetical protein
LFVNCLENKVLEIISKGLLLNHTIKVFINQK